MNKMLYPFIIALFAMVFVADGFAKLGKKAAAPGNSASSLELQYSAKQLDADDMREITAGGKITYEALGRDGIPYDWKKGRYDLPRSGNKPSRPCNRGKHCRR
jgi:hypothetical protein